MTKPTATDLLGAIREKMQQLSLLLPAEAYYVANAVHNDARVYLAKSNMGAQVDTANKADAMLELCRTASLHDPQHLKAQYDALCQLRPDNATVLGHCVNGLATYAEGVSRTQGRLAAETLSAINVAQSHPAADAATLEKLAAIHALVVPFVPLPPQQQQQQQQSLRRGDGGQKSGASPARQKRQSSLQPTREAPPLPSSNAWPPLVNGGGATVVSSPQHQNPATNGVAEGNSPQMRTGTDTRVGKTERATRVRSWLKSLRLHKYCAMLEHMNYKEMIQLTEADLERLGMSAKGARTKMLKSITGLRHTMEKAEETMAQGQNAQENGVFTETIARLNELFEAEQWSFLTAPRPDNFDVVREFMNTVHALYSGIILSHAHLHQHPAPHDVHGFFALLDRILRHEQFPVEEKKTVFNWKNDCQRVLTKWHTQFGSDVSFAKGMPAHKRPSSMVAGDPWGSGGGIPKGQGRHAHAHARANVGGGGGGGGDSRYKNRSGFENRTRSNRSGGGRDRPGMNSGAVGLGNDVAMTSHRTNKGPHAFSPSAAQMDGGAVHTSRSDEHPSTEKWDAFGFGPVSGLWEPAGVQQHTQGNPSGHDNGGGVSGGGGGGAMGGVPGLYGIWNNPPIGSDVSDLAFGTSAGGGVGNGAGTAGTGGGAGASVGGGGGGVGVGMRATPFSPQDGYSGPSPSLAPPAWSTGTQPQSSNPFLVNGEAGDVMDSLCVNIAENTLQDKRSTAYF